MGREDPKPRVVLVNQYCYPDVASTGHLIHILAHELADNHGFEVEVLTTQPSYGEKDTWVTLPAIVREGGVTYRRVWVPRMNKNSMIGRALKDFGYLVQIGLRSMFTSPKNTVYLYTTAPPTGGFAGAIGKLLRRQTYCTLLYDSHPHMGVLLGTFKANGFIEKFWHWINRRMYNGASRQIILCKAARKLLRDSYELDDETIVQIPNWADGDEIYPVKKEDTNFAKANDLVEPYTLLYSGNMGLYYEFETVLRAAELLKDEPFKLVLIGGGGKKEWCEQQVKERNLTNTVILPYQPFETLNDSLNACDASLVTIAPGIEGISFPSKLYTSLAVGKTIVAISEAKSELRDIVEENECGIWAEIEDGESLAEQLRVLIHNRDQCDEMGAKAYELFKRDYTRQICAAQYAQVLRAAGEESGVYKKS